MEYSVNDKSFYKYQVAITKAVNPQEVPVKQKHVRSAIIGTFQQQGAQIFWSIALRLPTMDDRIVAWKFCHVLHKVLREGHPLCLVQSQRHRNELDEVGKLWGHLKDGYGKLIRLYTLLMMQKLDFHRKNPRFPGHLGVTQDELESIGSNDINNYFEMSIDMFDYLDAILDLQAAIFGSLDMSRSNSMTSAGQCRLAPLIPCIQDASKLYDYCVKILFRLHSSLPPDTLQGHRDRFLKQFKQLQKFYQNTNALQYFKDLITVPPLPENPPNFLIQANLHTYVTQEVYVPQEPDDEPFSEGTLVDTTDATVSEASTSSSVCTGHTELIAERDKLIHHLQTETERLRKEIHKVVVTKDKDINVLQDQITTLATELATKDSELVQERQVKEELLYQASAVAQSQDSEQKAKDEKFNKIKDLYVKIREDHIKLLRDKAEIEKKLNAGSRRVKELESSNKQLEEKITELNVEITKQQVDVQQSSQYQAQEAELLRQDKEMLAAELEVMKQSVESAYRDKNQVAESLNIATAENAALNAKVSELGQRNETLNAEIDELKENLRTAQLERSGTNDNLLIITEENKNLKCKITEITGRVAELQGLLNAVELEKNETKETLTTVTLERDNLNVKLTDITAQVSELEQQLRLLTASSKEDVRNIVVESISEAKRIVEGAIHEIDNPALSAVSCSPDYFGSLVSGCSESLKSAKDQTHSKPIEFVRNVSALSHRLSVFLLQGRATSNSSPDIIFGEKMAEECKNLGERVVDVLERLKSDEPTDNEVERAEEQLKIVSDLSVTIGGNLRGENADNIADMVEDEMAAMDKAIEEAAGRMKEMLDKSRKADSGIKLEVNEKILDSCTTLMMAIKLLIQRSRSLQAEIAAQGKGTSDVKEFYKRNHQWTDGFISAAKAVAVAATFLLGAADNVISGKGKLEQLIAGAQEIAASTAQLVVASRVKAERKSHNLEQLTQASKGVTTATGAVVATVKLCNQLMDDEELDTSKLTLHQAKRLEMEAQVRVLELEKDLEQERLKLSALRRHHYQMAKEDEGWVCVD